MQIPKTLHIEKTLRTLEKLSEARETKDIAAADINQILKKWLDSKNLSMKEKKLLLFAAMDKFEEYPDLNPLWSQIVEDLKQSDRASLIKAALAAYYQSYGSSHSKTLQSILTAKMDVVNTNLSDALENKKIFDDIATHEIATTILESANPIDELKAVKLSGLLFSSRFMRESFKVVANQMSHFGYQRDKLNHFKAVFFSENDQGQEVFTLNGYENLYAKALLGYWDSQAPSKELKEYLKHLFLSNLRDPRAFPQRWSLVDEQYQKIIKRWLTEESFEMLIQVLDAVADLGHWNDRKDFWSYYLENEYISDSWVIFGTEAHIQATKLQREGLLSKSAGFARFQRGQGSVQANHSVILLKIGELVISEWTHSGRVRMFTINSVHAPEFYMSEYSVNSIRFETGYRYYNENKAIYINHNSNWQIQVAEFIRKHTGISHEILKRGYY